MGEWNDMSGVNEDNKGEENYKVPSVESEID